MGATGKLCVKHGGDCNPADASWLCDECARTGINKCECGGHARAFSEAVMCGVSCESCRQSVVYIGFDRDIRELWNTGIRGNFGSSCC